jgi:hypothetical protein
MASASSPPSQDYVLLSAEHAAVIRTKCARTGGIVIALSVLLGVVTVLLALGRPGLPSSIVLSTGVTGAGLGALSGVSLRSARSYLWGHYLNQARVRTARRVLLLLWIASFAVAALCYLGLITLALDADSTLGPAVLALFLPPAAFCALTATGFLTARQVLRPG